MKQVRLGMLLLLALSGCAALHRRELVRFSEERLRRARELHAEERAPVAYQRFVAARQKAEAAAPDSAERADCVSAARLWLEAALDEAERITLSEQRLVLEQESAALDEAYLAAQREQNALEDERARQLAARVAQQEAERALARAAASPARRIKLSAKDSERAALSLLQRAELVELSLPADTNAQARAELVNLLKSARAQLTKAPEQALRSADQALFAALALLAPARAQGAAPSPESKASLAEALRLTGAEVSRSELGLSASLANAGAAEARTLERLCSVASAYPQGLVHVLLAGREPDATRKLAQRGCTGERFRIRTTSQAQSLRFVFTAY